MKHGHVDNGKIELVSEFVAQHLQQRTCRGIVISVGNSVRENARCGGLLRLAEQLNVCDRRFQLPPSSLVQDSIASILDSTKAFDQIVGPEIPFLV